MLRVLLLLVLMVSAVPARMLAQQVGGPAMISSSAEDLPDSPGQTIKQQGDVMALGRASMEASGRAAYPPCNFGRSMGMVWVDPNRMGPRMPCSELIYPYQRFLDTDVAIPLTWKGKGYLAVHE